MDARSAYEDLPEREKEKVSSLVANNSLIYNRKLATPDHFKDLDLWEYGFARHKIAVPHPGSGRTTLSLTTYCHRFDGMSEEESQMICDELWVHMTQEKS